METPSVPENDLVMTNYGFSSIPMVWAVAILCDTYISMTMLAESESGARIYSVIPFDPSNIKKQSIIVQHESQTFKQNTILFVFVRFNYCHHGIMYFIHY